MIRDTAGEQWLYLGPLCGSSPTAMPDHGGLFQVGTITVANLLIFFTPVGDRPGEAKVRFAGQPAE
jgi:hypothetical protein